jgi:putative oxidoreductase
MRNPAKHDSSVTGLLPTAGWAATCLRLTLAIWWIIHWWFKVGVAGMPTTEMFFLHNGLPAWLAWFDVSFEVVVMLFLIFGLYVPLVCIVSLPILVAGMIVYQANGFYFVTGGIEFPIFWAIVQII